MATVIDSTGLTRDRLDVIVANLTAEFKAIAGDDIDVNPSSIDAQIIGIFCEAVDTVGQLLEAVYLSRTVAGAQGVSLSRLVLLNGISRNVASYSTAAVTHTGVPGTVIPDGSLVDNTSVPPSHFQTVGDVTIGAGGTVPGTVRATTKGPVFAAAGSIAAIVQPITGWTAVTNAAAVNLGSDIEADPALRSRRVASVAISAQSTVDSIYAALANIQGVSQAIVFENKTGAPISRAGSADLPANSIQCIVVGGLDADIAAAIWANASAGVTLVGAQVATVTDAQGIAQAIKFDRPTPVGMNMSVFLFVYKGTTLSTDQRLTLSTALANFGNAAATIGQVVRWADFVPTLVATLQALKVDVTTSLFQINVGIGGTSGGQQGDVVIPFTGLPVWDPSHVAILTSPLP